MAEPNPFEAPSETPPGEGILSDRELLELRRRPPRESFGDRYFWLVVVLLGGAVVMGPPAVWGTTSIWVVLFGMGISVLGLSVWWRER